jgi:hypothetical protein
MNLRQRKIHHVKSDLARIDVEFLEIRKSPLVEPLAERALIVGEPPASTTGAATTSRSMKVERVGI